MRCAAIDAIMSFSELILFALAVVVLLILGRRLWRIRLAASEKAWPPAHLTSAQLVYMERQFRARRPLRLTARVDRGYRQPNGAITLVELKTRSVSRAYLADIIELSAQRVAVEAQTAERVDDYGYVLVQQPGSRKKTAHRVKLLTNDQVIALAKRREAILINPHSAEYVRVPGLCRQCAFLSRCQPCSRGDG